MLYYLTEPAAEREGRRAVRARQLPRWNAGSLLLRNTAAPDIAQLLLVVDAVRYGLLELAGHALCLWAIPYLPRPQVDDPFTPFYVPTDELVFPHEKGLVIRRAECTALHTGPTAVPPVGAVGRTAAGSPDRTVVRGELSARECPPETEHDFDRRGCVDRSGIPAAGQAGAFDRRPQTLSLTGWKDSDDEEKS